ncbi:hypothetical protein C8P68_103192 [Mucilaginibacter yixingensis]|uniref:Uncharacterized protein n=1 Tax=Mucilaginibacter yixingensis TaxID=1295612 RepID=A0A2T5JAY5_9SPHI|nr:hypothetical protein C8P68_103192 [Mucilaginibacter yixingensis]
MKIIAKILSLITIVRERIVLKSMGSSFMH